jgi:hypothetical protein
MHVEDGIKGGDWNVRHVSNAIRRAQSCATNQILPMVNDI